MGGRDASAGPSSEANDLQLEVGRPPHRYMTQSGRDVSSR